MRIELPEPSLVVLIGASGSGKSSFAARHFPAPHALSLPYDVAFVMGVQGYKATAVVKHHHVPIAVGAAPTKHDQALIYRRNRCAALGRDIDATVKTSASDAKT